ncbi:MAG: LLM class flavin-dependent oxidoreductase [Alphaproteobacteria bacterium]|nr:LLM class flavin-dependent oxidoreductase [Alphaproteobacteria bacterium]
MEVWHLTPPSIHGIESVAADAEAWGFDGLALTDSQNQSPDTYVALTLAARATSTLKLGPGVTNALTRHPAVTAGAIASLQEASDGRAMLGIGRGDSSLFNIGHKPVGLAAFEAYLRDVQIYLSGGTLDAEGYDSTLKWLPNSKQGKVPLDVAATGPKVIAIGARHAERVSFSVGAEPERVSWAMAHVRETLGPDAKLPEMGLYLNVCVDDDVERAAEMARGWVGIFAHFTGMPGATRNRVRQSDHLTFDRLGDYDKPRHGRPDAAHAQALPQEFIERFAVIGPPSVCVEKLKALRDLGVHRIMITFPRTDQFGDAARHATERFARDVLPEIRQ